MNEEWRNELVTKGTAYDALHDEIIRRRIDEDTNDDGALDEFDTEAILRQLPSVQETHEERTETHACDCVSGVAAIVAAIEAVDEWDGGYNVQRANMIRDAIKALPSAQQWTLCSERLPEEDVEVLITYRYKEGEGDTSHAYIDITTYGQMYFGGNKVGDHKHWRQPFEYFTSNYEVVAWMPLPESYKGEQG